jgi:hypothetical protein
MAILLTNFGPRWAVKKDLAKKREMAAGVYDGIIGAYGAPIGRLEVHVVHL